MLEKKEISNQMWKLNDILDLGWCVSLDNEKITNFETKKWEYY